MDHGANPGLISSLAKQGILDVACSIAGRLAEGGKKQEINQAISSLDFAKLAYLIGLKTIHISERDTQKRLTPKKDNEFINTWSVVGFYEEGITFSELGWGTHEKKIPEGAHTHSYGPRHQIFLNTRGIDTWVESWVPSGPIKGMAIRHGEAFSLPEFLSYQENGKLIYRPTVHYAYLPCEDAIYSLNELKQHKLQLQENQFIIDEEIVDGHDELGCLLLGHDLGAWWVGSILDIHEARRLVPHQNATTVQVAIGVIAALQYCIQNPSEGICLPEHLPHDFVLGVAKPYLGKFVSTETSWRPTKQAKDKDNWQFEIFRTDEKTSVETVSV